ncbi:MFS transporter [Desulfobacter curvatus]|uniref:MFS transporter n=1 Tax=Desulfobacter curvatus TaxID=2290 RepID=UPI00037CD980|nr:MFS transporter [Desulfobacter curvatus]
MNKSAILFILSTAVGVAMMGLGIIWPLIPVYAVELGAGGFLVGLIVASFNISRTLLSPFSGLISDKWGRKRFIASGLFFYAVLSVFYVLPKNAETLILIRLLHGIASLLVVPVAMALTADIAPPRKLGLYMGTVNMAIMIGLGFGPAMGGMIRDTLGFNAAFYIMGALALITSLVVAVFLPADKAHLNDIKRPKPYPVRKIIANKTAAGILIMRFFAASGQGSVYTFLPILAMQIDLSSSQVGIILTMNIFLIAFLQRISGRLADRINPKHLIIAGTFACGITVLGMPFVHGFIPILILNILMGMANGLSLPGGLVITGRLGQTMGMASIMSINDAAWGLGFIVSPILSGLILDWIGVSYVFIAGSLLILLGGIAVTVFLWDYDNSLNPIQDP